jgi:hypothetical protein
VICVIFFSFLISLLVSLGGCKDCDESVLVGHSDIVDCGMNFPYVIEVFRVLGFKFSKFGVIIKHVKFSFLW